MASGDVLAAAEWALWGRSAPGAGDRLLECSDGIVSRANFEHLLTRYSPGTLESWPQVTISWLPDDHSGTRYLAIAIHEPGGAAAEDLAGSAQSADGESGPASRDVQLTRYFCLPFGPLAEGAVRYGDLYRAVREIPLPVADRGRVAVRLPASRAGGPGSDLAMQVAALLLTGKPVCILRAVGISADERLRFVDQIAALLPYGIRSRLSASTWVSSTYHGHRFRLFFTSAPRRRDDHVVSWGQDDNAARPDGPATEYLSWLREDPADRAARLATLIEPVGFSEDEVRRLTARLGLTQAPELTGPRQRSLRKLGRAPEINALLRSCGRQMDRGDPAAVIEELQRHSYEPTAPEDRRTRREIIQEHGLLREDVCRDVVLRAELYVVLFALAFGSPLTYQDYCAAEKCADTPAGHPLHLPLLAVMSRCELDDSFVRSFVFLLLLDDNGEQSPGRVRTSSPLSAARLTELVTEPALRREHARLAWTALLAHSDHLDRRALQQVLRQRRYHATQLQEWHPDEPEYQVTVLRVLLRLAYGPWLGRSAIAEILAPGRETPTAALLSAVLISMDGGGGTRRRVQQLLLDSSGAQAD